MNDEQWAEQTNGKIEERDVQVRQVNGGYVLLGVRRFLDPVTKVNTFSVQYEAVAATSSTAGSSVGTFLTTGQF